MTLQDKPVLRLNQEEAAFLRIAALSILVASHGPDNVPFVTRALGHRFSPTLDQITLFLPVSDAKELLSQVASNGMIAATFALPSTHQALQLKGSNARVEKLSKADLEVVNACRQAFIDHLVKLGYPRAIFEAMLDCQPDDLAGIRFTPAAGFSQTPGPGAGRPIGIIR